MKNLTLKFGLILLLLVSISGCGEDFLSTYPTEDVSNEIVTTSPANMMLGINGIHRSLYVRYGCQGCVGLGALMIHNDAMGDDLVMTRTSSTWFYGAYRWQVHRNATARDNLLPWTIYYQVVRNANVIIDGEENAEGPQAEIDIPVGQAYFYRAFSHFQLVQLYAERYRGGETNSQPGIPIVTLPENVGQPRATVEQVYQQIHDDLTEAINRLENYSRPNKSHIDASVARGLKARVYLVQQDWPNAITYAQDARAGYSLMTQSEYTAGFNDYTNVEWMWGSHIAEDQSDRFGNFGAQISRNNSTTFIRTNPMAINENLYSAFPASDIRLANFDPTGEHEDLDLPSNFSKAPYTNEKFIAVSESDSRVDVPYMRAAEMYLIEAEAKANLGDPTAADVLFDLVSERDDDYVRSTNTGQALLDEIYLNRRLEFWGEGFRFYDLKRLNQDMDRTNSNHNTTSASNVMFIEAGTNEWVYLIPQDELNANPEMEQNPTND
ncbi:RagB/SusD family nutrient uptake outer membrane protein [Rhodohalobacter halophilus]|uniref:RagB/SusD family nutrient uptake outer membrane protein n=1 Tax=Rhodohalobacter halophilus TaxID=1812810 RepID=UPI00083F95C9|nr:RagB/SusD family nutrient uptake outer membrane protein [Rhodohalobacter halophilus]